MSKKSEIEFDIKTNIADISQLTLKKDSIIIIESEHLINDEQKKNLIDAVKHIIGGADNEIFIMPHGTKLKTLDSI